MGGGGDGDGGGGDNEGGGNGGGGQPGGGEGVDGGGGGGGGGEGGPGGGGMDRGCSGGRTGAASAVAPSEERFGAHAPSPTPPGRGVYATAPVAAAAAASNSSSVTAQPPMHRSLRRRTLPDVHASVVAALSNAERHLSRRSASLEPSSSAPDRCCVCCRSSVRGRQNASSTSSPTAPRAGGGGGGGGGDGDGDGGGDGGGPNAHGGVDGRPSLTRCRPSARRARRSRVLGARCLVEREWIRTAREDDA